MTSIFQNARRGAGRIALFAVLACATAGYAESADWRPPAADFTSNRTGAVRSSDAHFKELIVTNGGGGGGFTSLMSGVVMASSRRFAYVGYGPYVNTSPGLLEISLVTALGNDDAELGAFVDGRLVANGTRSTDFVVPPGSTYNWYTKHTAIVNAWVSISGATPAMVGLPSANDFSAPVTVLGSYNSCVDWWIAASEYEPDRFDATEYLYSSTQSDKASTGNGLVSGPKPSNPGTCTVQFR